jgi:hypothetical protein
MIRPVINALRVFLCAAVVAALTAPAAAAAPAPAWTLQTLAMPANFTPGDESGDQFYEVALINSGGGDTDGSPLTITATLPAGIEVKSVELPLPDPPSTILADYGPTLCEIDASEPQSIVECSVPSQLPNVAPALLGPGEGIRMNVRVAVPAGTTGALTGTIAVQGGGAPAEALSFVNEASSDVGHSGFQQFTAALLGEDGASVTQASSHPYQFTTSFAVNSKATPPGSEADFVPAGGDVKDVEVDLPPGLIGNPTAISRCTAQQFNTLTQSGGEHTVNACPDGSVVGFVTVRQIEGEGAIAPVPLYNLVPTRGMPAQLGFQVFSAPFYIDTKLRTGSDYGVTATVRNASEVRRITAALVTIWGDPVDQIHDPLRGSCLNGIEGSPFSLGSCPADIPQEPFLRLPTSCQTPLDFAMRFDTWTNPGGFVSERDIAGTPTGCDQLAFDPSIRIVPTSSVADSPSGLQVNLHIPQEESSPGPLARADLRNAVVTLPAGVSINPASANGLAACASHQIDINGAGPARCPDASKIGAVEISTPLLDRPISGGVYVAAQTDNPFRSLIALYIAAHDPQLGVVVKLAGRVDPDPATGRLTTTFVDNPQLPFEDLRVEFFDGPRAPLRTPMDCGAYAGTTRLKPWSAPQSGPDAAPSDSFPISSGPNGGCPTGDVAPVLSAGVVEPVAGAHSPFILRLTRADGTGEFSSVNAITPRGLTARLKGVASCSDAAIGQALSRVQPGEGAAEIAAPSCPPASAVGSVIVGAGAGPSPFYTRGIVYLAGPYKGAPISLATVVPAIAGPFDLGVVVSRIALQVDTATAQVTAQSDRLPTILAGIPLDIRDITVRLDRPDFTLAPTNCTPAAVEGTVWGIRGDFAQVADRFQVGACRSLGFRPDLTISLKGGTRRSDHSALRSVLRARSKDANIRRAVVTLPPSQFIDNARIASPCTRAQFNENRCPKASLLGRARAFSPLLDEPLEGPVYFRANGGARLLPDIVADLRGQIRITLVGAVDSKKGRIRTTFATVPDAPVSKFVLRLFGGKRGLLVNSKNLCRQKQRATVRMAAHNGRAKRWTPLVKTSCKARPRR